jgi:hypothetical protein
MTGILTETPPKVVKVDNTYFYAHFLREVEQEIQQKAFVVNAGLDTFSKAELFAYTLLEARGYFSVLPEPTSEETSDDD